METIKRELGKMVKRVRKGKGLTREKFSEIIDISIRQLAKIEDGEAFVSAKSLSRICRACKIQPSDLFDFDLDSAKG